MTRAARVLGRARPTRRTASFIRASLAAVTLLRLPTLLVQLRIAVDPRFADQELWLAELVTQSTYWWPAAGLAVMAVPYALGVSPRATGTIMAGSILALQAVHEVLLYNHLFVLAAALLIVGFGQPSRTASEDAAAPPALPWLLLRTQVSAVYFFAGVAKINEDFLSGLVLHERLSRSMVAPVADSALTTDADTLFAVALGTIVVELYLAGALWFPRIFVLNYAIAGTMHVAMTTIAVDPSQLAQLLLFALTMLSVNLVFQRGSRAMERPDGCSEVPAHTPGTPLPR